MQIEGLPACRNSLRLRKFSHLEHYLEQKEDVLKEWNAGLGEKGKTGANTRRLTNVGTFRAYVEAYLKNHPQIHKGMTLLVRQLQPGCEGLPIEFYCFTNTTAWGEYEAIQSDIFDHMIALLPEFDLRVFQDPTGRDFKQLVHEK